MAKKCIPGVICVENMTLFILIILSISVGYLYYRHYGSIPTEPKTYVVSVPFVHSPTKLPTSVSLEVEPPLNTIDIRGRVPVNIRTSTADTSYRQIGILTKGSNGGKEPLILPLFGRNLLNGRDKWQYYTMANSGFNARLPISVNGRSCTGEYGCDSVSNGDAVYVEGYDDTFRATIYENASLNYLPF